MRVQIVRRRFFYPLPDILRRALWGMADDDGNDMSGENIKKLSAFYVDLSVQTHAV